MPGDNASALVMIVLPGICQAFYGVYLTLSSPRIFVSDRDMVPFVNISRIIFYILAISFGVLMFVYNEIDDSPSGQLLGLLAVITGIVGVIKSKTTSA